MERLVRSCYKKKGGYIFAQKAGDIARKYGIDRIARLASNENPYPLSAAAREAAENALRNVNRYPDERTSILTDALRVHYGDYSFVCGVGMDGVIETVIRTLVDPGEQVVISTPTFSFYALAATGQGAEVVNVPRAEGLLGRSQEKLIKAGSQAKIVIVCSPNNPTGNATPVDVVAELAGGD